MGKKSWALIDLNLLLPPPLLESWPLTNPSIFYSNPPPHLCKREFYSPRQLSAYIYYISPF